jgi:tetratricopeptide (TPR) repeat protein
MRRNTLVLCLLISTLGLAWAYDQNVELDQFVRAGEASYRKADYEAARIAYEKAWELAQQTPSNTPVRYDILKRLTAVSAAAGQFAEADNYLQLAINWREISIGRDDPKIADDLLESVTLCRGMKQFDRAMAILERVRFMHAKSAGPGSAAVADDFSSMAQVQMDQKNGEGAASSLAAALQIRAKLAGQYDASLLPDLDRLGPLLIMLQRYDKAEDTFRFALVIRESLLGKESPDLIVSVDGLAYACFGQKKYDDADPLYQRLIALWTASAGKEHPMVALAYDKVAVFYAEQKKFDQAKAAADHANAVRAHFFATGLSQEATEQQAEGNVEETKALYRRALAVLDPPDPMYVELRAQIESILKSMEEPKRKLSKPPPRRK